MPFFILKGTRPGSKYISSNWMAKFRFPWPIQTTHLQQLTLPQVISLLHRGQDAYIALMHKPDRASRMVNIGAHRSDDLESRIVTSGWWDTDLYWSINSLYPQSKYRTLPLTDHGYEMFNRRKIDFRWLNAAVVDIDVDKGANVPFEDQIEAVFGRIERTGLPKPSFVVDSGRGMWLCWLLKSGYNQNEPVWAWKLKVTYLERLQAEVVKLFEDMGPIRIGADTSCTDISRVMRVPGSLNTKTGRRVTYYLCDEHRYLLQDLGRALRVEDACSAVLRPQSKLLKNPAKLIAYRARWEKEARAIQELGQFRGGYEKGRRGWAMYLLTACLHKAGHSESQIRAALKHLAREFKDRLTPDRDIDTYLNQGMMSRFHIRRSTIVDRLAITRGEAERIWPLKRTQLDRRADHALRKAERLAIVYKYLQNNPGMSLRELSAAMRKDGHEVSKSRLARYKQCIIDPNSMANTHTGPTPPFNTLAELHGTERISDFDSVVPSDVDLSIVVPETPVGEFNLGA